MRRGSCRKPVPFHEKRTAPHIRLVGRQRFEAVLYARPCAVLRIRTKKKKKKEKRRSIYKFMRRSTVFIFNHSFIQHNSTQLNSTQLASTTHRPLWRNGLKALAERLRHRRFLDTTAFEAVLPVRPSRTTKKLARQFATKL